MPNLAPSISRSVAWKFFRLSFSRWFIHLFVCSFWHFPQETWDRFININNIVNHLICDIHDQSMSRLHQTRLHVSEQYHPKNLHIFSQWWSKVRHYTVGEIKNPNQKILVLLNTLWGLSLLAKKIAASGKEIGTWHIKLVSDSKNRKWLSHLSMNSSLTPKAFAMYCTVRLRYDSRSCVYAWILISLM